MNFIPKIEYTELITGTPKTLTFDSPPEGDPFRERTRHIKKDRRSSSGIKQTQHNYALKQYRLQFIFQSEAVRTAFEDFIDNHAARGGTFNYFPSNDEVDFETFEFSGRGYDMGRPIPAATPGEFEYDFKFTIEKVK